MARADQLLAVRLEQTAARLEAHTVNLGHEQDRLANERLRGVVDEVRANAVFVADAVAALERLGRAVDRLESELAATGGAGLVLRPHVHAALAGAGPGPVAVVGVPDAALVRELVAMGRTVTVHPDPAAAAAAGTGGYPVVAWSAPSMPDQAAVHAALALVADGGCLVVAHPGGDASAWGDLDVARSVHELDGSTVVVDRVARR
jgi:hypothetical protein